MSWTLHEESLKKKELSEQAEFLKQEQKNFKFFCYESFYSLSIDNNPVMIKLLVDVALLQIRVIIIDKFAPIMLVLANCNI